MAKKQSKRGKEERILLRILIVMLIIPATLITSIIVVANLDTSGQVYNSLVIRFMPKEINITEIDENFESDKKITLDDGSPLILHVEYNKDFNIKKDIPMHAYNIYYLQNGEKVYLKDGKFENKTGTIDDARLPFLLIAKKNQNKFNKILTYILMVYFAVSLVMFIRFWFLSWSRREDEKAEWQRLAIEQSKNKKAER